jgi:hypothetical protein
VPEQVAIARAWHVVRRFEVRRTYTTQAKPDIAVSGRKKSAPIGAVNLRHEFSRTV